MLSTLTSWLGRPARTRRKQPRRARLAADVLEDRTVPAGPADTPWPTFGMNAQHTGDSPYVGPQTGAVAHDVEAAIIGPDGLISGGRLFNFDGSLQSMYWGYTFPSAADDGTVYSVESSEKKLIASNPNLPGAFINDDMQLVGGVKWTFDLGWQQRSPTIGSDGTIYVSSLDSNLYAINPDGTLKWKFKAAARFESVPALSLDGLTVYAGCDDNNLYAFNTGTGTLRWKYKASDDINGAPAVDADSNIYFTTSNWNAWSVKPTGKLNWKVPLRQQHGSTFAFNYSDPAIDQSNGTVYFGGFDGMFAYSFTGQLKWKYTTGSRVDAHPAIGADGLVYFSAANGTLYAVQSNGTLQWSAANSGGTPLLGDDGTLYCGGKAFRDGGVYRPTVRWLEDSPDPIAPGGNLFLRAREISDNGAIVAVNYYRDTNANDQLDIGDDLVGTNTDGSNFWGIVVTAPGTSGTYTYFAQAVDNDGHLSNVVMKTNTVAGALLAAGAAPALHDAGPVLAAADVQPLLDEALRQWQRAGADTEALGAIQIQISNLGDSLLGLASGSTITLDDDAAGWGWFVDPTPRSGSEYHRPGNQGELGRMDLLSVLVHEIGHLLGHDHDEGGSMSETLAAGERVVLHGALVAPEIASFADDEPSSIFARRSPRAVNR
jgi:outer membrane protein assembly factor BamB